MLVLEAELEVAREQLAREKHSLRSAERASSDGRMTDPELNRHTIQRRRWAVMETEKWIARLERIVEDDGA